MADDTTEMGTEGVTVPVYLEPVGIAETEKAMRDFLDSVEDDTRKFKDTQDELNEALDHFVKVSNKNLEREKKESTIIGKLLKQHKQVGIELVKLRKEEMAKAKRDPQKLKAIDSAISHWGKERQGLEAREDAGKKQNQMAEKVTSHLQKEKSALNDLIGLGKMLPLVLGGATIIEGLASMVKSFMEWERSVAKLNEVFFVHNSLIGESDKLMQGYGVQLGMSQEELAGVAAEAGKLKSYLVLGEKPEKAFQTMTHETILLHKATGLATSSAQELLSTLVNKFGVGIQQVRSVSAAFAYVTSTARITADELSSFLKTLDPIFSRLPKLSGEAKGKLTTDMMAIAGALGDAFGDPQHLSGMFAKMLNPLDKQGNMLVAKIANLTGRMPAEVTKLLKSGDLTTVSREYFKALGTMSEDQLNMLDVQYSGLLGDYQQLTKYAAAGRETDKDFKKRIEGAREAAEKQKLHAEMAKKTTIALDQMTNVMKRAISQVWRVFGGIITSLMEGPASKLTTWLDGIGKWMQGPGKVEIQSFMNRVKELAAIVWKDLKKAFAWLMEGNPPRIQVILEGVGEVIKGVAKAVMWLAESNGKGLTSWLKSLPVIGQFVQILKAAKQGLDNLAWVFKQLKQVGSDFQDMWDDLRDALGGLKLPAPLRWMLSIFESIAAAIGKALGFFRDLLKETVTAGPGGLIGKLFGKATGAAGGAATPATPAGEEASMLAVRRAIQQIAKLPPDQAKRHLTDLMATMPRKYQRRIREQEPMVNAILEGKTLTPAAPAPLEGKTLTPAATPAMPMAPLEPLTRAETPMAPAAAPRVNVTSDPNLARAMADQVKILKEVRDALLSKGNQIPAGLSLAIASMGG